MWAGNVPSDATHDELWRYFNKTSDEPLAAEEQTSTGVLSIFLISRSSCAFINFDTEEHLHAAIERFNGKSLRPLDPHCPRLVCRVRRKGDDLKAGVGGQRGTGMHTRWVKDQKRKGPELNDTSETSTSDGGLSATSSDLAPIISPLAISSDEEGRPRRAARHSSSSGSFASTNSSILSRYFPNRFFILKSLTQFDLDLSVEKGLWATQKHNEGILDQAYRTSQHVYLIFSVNKSGEFYGYARMAGPVRRGEHRVSWATRTGSSGSSRSSLSPATGRVVGHTPEEPASPSRVSQLKGPPKNFFNNTPRLVDESPQPAGSADIRHANEQAGYISDSPRPSSAPRPTVQSAPAELGVRSQLTMRTPAVKHSLDNQMPRIVPMILSKDSSVDDFELDPNAPIRAIRSGSGQSHESSAPSRGASILQAVAEEEEKGEEVVAAAGEQELDGEAAEETWGESFKVEWLCTDKLPFHKTRHIRNPWNHDREVKVSRDGTEVEPLVGQRLINDWERLVGVQDPSLPKMGEASKRGSRSAPLLVAPVAVKAGKQANTVGAEI
ncbi:YT521-B-like domain-containing protein [Collybia nuda]|uniref:YT521-B-like domain-containing protein n=1 Tax=Collybia nuda TaxID=64659 RepID=A0A9P6CLW2_9AGAR|nr:YT521-B-like domain-containing protein [Collybia nuda]